MLISRLVLAACLNVLGIMLYFVGGLLVLLALVNAMRAGVLVPEGALVLSALAMVLGGWLSRRAAGLFARQA